MRPTGRTDLQPEASGQPPQGGANPQPGALLVNPIAPEGRRRARVYRTDQGARAWVAPSVRSSLLAPGLQTQRDEVGGEERNQPSACDPDSPSSAGADAEATRPRTCPEKGRRPACPTDSRDHSPPQDGPRIRARSRQTPIGPTNKVLF